MKPEKLEATIKYVHLAKVTLPFGSFPIDMLRYDRCVPNQEIDASNIIDSFHERVKNRVVVVRCYTVGSVVPWTVARWESFGAKIVPINSQDAHNLYNLYHAAATTTEEAVQVS